MEREFASGVPVLRREPWTVRVAVWSARHRYAVLAAWFVLIVSLMLGAASLGGQRSQAVMDKGKTIGDSQTSWNAFNEADACPQGVRFDPSSSSRRGQSTAGRPGADCPVRRQMPGLRISKGPLLAILEDRADRLPSSGRPAR